MTDSRVAAVERKTRETDISLNINLDGSGKSDINCPVKFLSHMLELFAKHGFFDLTVRAKGDIEVDYHHTMEDLGLVLGDVLAQALGDKAGIGRYGFSLPMDEAEAIVLIDLGGRIDFQWDVDFKGERVGDVSVQMFPHFFKSLSEHLKCNLHIRACGQNDHHVIEGVFKAFARALKQAVAKESGSVDVPSSKGRL